MIGKKSKGFTLIEMIMVITLFAIIILIAFEAMGNIAVFRTRLASRLDIEQDLYYTTEMLSSEIKDFGGDIDYEEYFNRKMIGIQTGSGHYSNFSGFGNYGSGSTPGTAGAYGDGPYLCLSGDGTPMGVLGCAINSFNNYGSSTAGKPQRFGEYALQFIDYNSNASSDLGDENGDGNITGDDDDENIGQGQEAFTGNKVEELYLIRKGKENERMLLRLNIIKDPNALTGSTCTFPAGTGSGCLGNIQILKLNGKDYGLDHSGSTNDSGQFDGRIDTRICNNDFYCPKLYNIPGSNEGRIDLLPDYINIKNIKFYVYPKKDYKFAWAESDPNTNINPYVKINITLGYARSKRKILKGINPEINITTTINLTKN
ncbi:MAG: prepilin-type N-terminal cleavage/methylation domain-containing protein [Candidatus Gracilibacteria bacterium]|nr:prepilin-type N-terminal cleavage/methylation domain-containing protein [Candidatus Gracilibacteria bacterium]MDD2908624.1 prepilin-type N-terminal cleavage/methylation domain-containing protein [Candidatus Gracilibacteria bacterium]